MRNAGRAGRAAGRLDPRTLTEEELVRWGERVGQSVEPPLWVSLYGPLGAGKSVLARAICRGAGVSGHVPSPSFTLVKEYFSSRGFSIHHVDLFRLCGGDPLEPLGWGELLASPGLVLLEWACRVPGQQPEDRWEVEIGYGRRPDERVVEVTRLHGAPGLIGW